MHSFLNYTVYSIRFLCKFFTDERDRWKCQLNYLSHVSQQYFLEIDHKENSTVINDDVIVNNCRSWSSRVGRSNDKETSPLNFLVRGLQSWGIVIYIVLLFNPLNILIYIATSITSTELPGHRSPESSNERVANAAYIKKTRDALLQICR